MIEILKRNSDQTYDIISLTEIVIGDNFEIGTKDGQAIYKTVDNIIEQRKSKGSFRDENNRPFWAKIS